VVVAEDEQRFAQAVSSLLQSPEQRHDLGRAGRAYVEAHHQWDLIAARLERLYQSVAAERGPRLERVAG
jgi:glycosyltransferase involved in cell wall biosynthesis